MNDFNNFWRGKRVFVTGHTGFKGAWLLLLLEEFGADVVGYALPPDTDPSLYDLCKPWTGHRSILADIRDLDQLSAAMADFNPEIAIHMAAQALVRRSYADPVTTFETNVTGTVNFLNALWQAPACRAAVVVTSDKVYDNRGGNRRFSEHYRLGGSDPYSASKACAELATASYAASFSDGPAIATARAGNVVGGGDWAEDRLIPDCIRAMLAGKQVELRYPNATRPWQGVLDVLRRYLIYASSLHDEPASVPKALNFGPRESMPMSACQVCEHLARSLGFNETPWRHSQTNHPPEAPSLQLDASLAEKVLGWRPQNSGAEAIATAASWYRSWHEGASARAVCEAQIAEHFELTKEAMEAMEAMAL